jgi:hypothetical protein
VSGEINVDGDAAIASKPAPTVGGWSDISWTIPLHSNVSFRFTYI